MPEKVKKVLLLPLRFLKLIGKGIVSGIKAAVGFGVKRYLFGKPDKKTRKINRQQKKIHKEQHKINKAKAKVLKLQDK